MIEYFEKLAERIVDFLDTKKTINSKKKIVNKSSNIKSVSIEQVDYSYYKIIPYKENSFGYETFLKLLNSFSYFSDRINFFIYGNNTYSSLVIGIPSVLAKKFVTAFYNYFPSSKLEKLDDMDVSLYEASFDNFYYSAVEKIKFADNKKKDFFYETFFLFKDIPANDYALIKYSLILNSEGEVEYETLIDVIVNLFKYVWYFFSMIFSRIILGRAPLKKPVTKKQKLAKGIKGTAISIATKGYKGFQGQYKNFLKNSLSVPLESSKEEIFSQIDKEDFPYLFNLPTKNKKIDSLEYINYKRLAPPPFLPSESDGITKLGYADWADENKIVGLKQEDKARHVYIVGKTGVGKSTLLSNMVYSDITSGRGLALIDPHGDLIESILEVIPENRKDDVVLFDVSDTDYPVGFNFFDVKEGQSKDLMVSTVLSIFKKLYGYSWGPRLEYILRNTLLALADYPEANFLHIPKMLTDKDFRKKVLIFVKDEVIKDFWEKEFSKRSERFASEAISPILNKVGQFISSPIIRNIFGQQKSSLDIQDIMQNGKILLVNLSKGLIGEDNSALVGSFIVSQLQVETMKRAALPMEQRKDFSLYIDEFQNFATESFTVILSEARKYKLSLIVANQYISQLDEKVQNAIFGNVGNLVVFNSADVDAEILARQFKNQVSVNDIISIPKFRAYTRLMVDGNLTDVFGLVTSPLEENLKKGKDYVNEIKELSRKKYGVKKDEIQLAVVNNEQKLSEKVDLDKNLENSKKTSNLENTELSQTNTNIGEDKGDIFEGVVKLKFNYGLFVIAGEYEGLLHKKNIHLPEGIKWKDYFNIGDKVKVKLLEIKEIDGQKKAVWEHVV